MALRRARPGTGSSVAFLRERTAVKRWPDLGQILAGLRWAVIGGVATRAYMPERATQDIDILVWAGDAAEVRARLQQAGFVHRQELAVGGATWQSPSGVSVDVIESRQAWVEEALGRLASDPQGLPVLALPYLVLMKVQTGRTQDLADAARMLGLASARDRDEARAVIRRWLPDAVEDVESLITLGELEMGESNQRRVFGKDGGS